MRAANKLSARRVAELCRPGVKPGLHGDGHGLYLQVSAYGTTSWIFRYQIDGVAHKKGLGATHTVSLAEAREEAKEARKLTRKGIDPIQVEKAERMSRKAEAAKAVTFRECAARYIEANRQGWKNRKHARQWGATFNETRRGARVYPAATEAFNDLPVSAIDTPLVLKALEPIWTKTPESASRARGRIAAVLDWARVRGYRDGENPARWSGHLDHLLPARAKISPVKHHDAVPYKDLPAFVAELRAKPGVSARALEFIVLTAARTGEAIGARWDEIDLKARLWTVPAGRMKAGKEHRVPLSDRAVEVLAGLPRDGEYVFPGARAGKPLSSNSMLELVRAMRGKGATVHGFRSTFRDWGAEQTSYPGEMLELALAHAVADKVEAAYRRLDMLEKRRRLMEAWSNYCAKAPAKRENNVTPMRGRAS
jgi:integrase